MYSLLLAIIYAAFVSLGLPDALLGSAWPVMQGEFGVPVSYAGCVSMIIAAGTVVSSLLSDRLTKCLGANRVTAVSVLMTAVALLGFSFSGAFPLLCLWAIPYGLGAGAVDAALNNYVALHYKARHMSWLHCFWGVGAAAGPYIMGACLSGGQSWQSGYRIVSILQFILTAVLFLTLPLWKKVGGAEADKGQEKRKALSLKEIFGIPGVPFMLIAFFSYSAVEQTSVLWASSYLVQVRGVGENLAASFASLFVGGITVGRLISGFISEKLGDKNMIRLGVGLIALGGFMILLPLEFDGLALVGLVVVGIGCAPTYPAIIHSTPENFGKENSQAVIGVQMAAAYIGTTLTPPLFGLIAQHIHIGLYPVYILLFALLMFLMSERVNRIVAKRRG